MTISETDDSAPVHGAPDVQPLIAGARFHRRYEIVRCLGAGGMGTVYEVLHLETQRRRVLKTMLPSLVTDSDMRNRFKLEATITAGIESEHIVEVFDAGIDSASGLPFMVMEYLRGENLASVLSRGPVPTPDAIAILYQASLALGRTHAAGIVHRDLKPENMFLTKRDDGSLRLKILDFGIAKVVALSTNVNTTRSFGTPLYMSPEQIRGDGDIDGRADLYALGQLGYTLLVGKAYWQPEAERAGGVYPLLLKLMQGMPESASIRAAREGIVFPAEFNAWFSRAAHPEASQRFDSARDLVEHLALALQVPLPKPATPNALVLDSNATAAEADSQIPRGDTRSPVTLAGLAKSSRPKQEPNSTRSPGILRRRNATSLSILAFGAALLLATIAFFRNRSDETRARPIATDTSTFSYSTVRPSAFGAASSVGPVTPPIAVSTRFDAGVPGVSPAAVHTAAGAVEVPFVRESGQKANRATGAGVKATKSPGVQSPNPTDYDPSDFR